MDLAARVQRWWQRSVAPRPWLIDGLIGTTFVIAGLISQWGGQPNAAIHSKPSDAVSTVLVLVIAVPYYFRRRAPLLVLAVSTAGLALLVGLDYYEGLIPTFLLVGAYTVGSWCPARRVVLGYIGFLGALGAVYFSDPPDFSVGVLASNTAFYTAAFVIGWSVQSRRARLVALEERAEALERERDEEARRAVADERLRIAQELHDVVAHSMGVIAVQAGVGLHVIDADPAEAKRSLEAISTTSRSTLTEMRRLLGVLRDEGDAGYLPAPGLADLARLVDDVTEAGVPVDLESHGDHPDVPHGVELTAYRIVQEALTNVLKHAGPARARVTVDYELGALRIEVVDDGRGVNGRAGGGHGLLGMRERVAVYGGSLETGLRPSGGFRVAAWLPYDPNVAADPTDPAAPAVQRQGASGAGP